MEIWVVSETRFHVEIQGIFLNRVEMRGKFHQTCKQFGSPKNDIKSSLGYFHIIEIPPVSLNCILKFLREARGKIPRGNIPRDFHRERKRKYPHRKFPFISPFISAEKS